MGKKEKIILLMLLLIYLFAASNVYGQNTGAVVDLSVTVPDFGMRFGLEYQFTDLFGVKADIGTTIFSFEGNFALTYDMMSVMYLYAGTVSFDFCAGIIDGALVFSDPASFMWNLGLIARLVYPFSDRFSAGIELGAGYPLFYEDGVFSSGSNAVLGIWPHLALAGRYRL